MCWLHFHLNTVNSRNLVVNNFTFDSSNRSVLPGLNCLQRDFECNRNSPRYARFAINSGGTRFVSADGTEYEAETASLGAASFNVTSTQKWAVSNTGLYADRQNPTYTMTNLLQVSRTNTPELFQSSRSSPGSLRYYGLGLENGNYTVNLLFAETGFPAQSSQTWQSLARRVFDIYVQGVLYDGREVAVKRLSVASNQGTSEFVTEIATISAVQHRNLVKLHGCCIKGSRRLLVYEYLENKSLDKALGKEAMQLDWPTRFSICLGTARGLAYLHEESSPRIVHRDVKASNILLDAELCPKISG